MKPLELTVYPRERQCACCGPIYTLPTGEIVTSYKADSAARQKRFAEAELAAECYRQMVRACGESGMVVERDGNDFITIPGDAIIFGPKRLETHRLGEIKRFATLPHAADKDYQ